MSQRFEFKVVPAAGSASHENLSNDTKGVGRYHENILMTLRCKSPTLLPDQQNKPWLRLD